MASWQLAPALARLLKEVNEKHPTRSKISDGTIGDAAHATRKSDHNPDDRGIVNALDLTNDPVNGFYAHDLAMWLAERKDPRVAYVISKGMIWTPAKGWHVYTGANPHVKHVHISVNGGLLALTVSPWFEKEVTPVTPPPPVSNEYVISGRPVAIRTAPGGYYIFDEAGGVTTFGVPFHGSANGRLTDGEVIVDGAADGFGYILLGSKGSVFAFSAVYRGRVIWRGSN